MQVAKTCDDELDVIQVKMFELLEEITVKAKVTNIFLKVL